MSDSQSVWDMIPRPAKFIALALWAGLGSLFRFVLLPTDAEMSAWMEWQKILFAFGLTAVLAAYVLLIGYVFADARRRCMRYVLWTWLAALIPNGVGVLLYFVIRDPLPIDCPNCGEKSRPGFVYCPKCGSALKRSCEGCGRGLEAGWSNCAYCGKRIGNGAGTPAAAQG